MPAERRLPVAPAHAEPDAYRMPRPTEPLLAQQWHLSAPDPVSLRLGRAWESYNGAGVRLAVVDEGFDTAHPDLAARYAHALDHDARDRDADARAEGAQRHGTAVAGVAVASADASNVVGVAGGAALVGIRIGFDAAAPWSQYADALGHAWRNADAANMSWGFVQPFVDDFAGNAYWFGPMGAALADGARLGRGGLGTVWVASAGNTRASGGDVNHHNLQNDPHVMAVGATGRQGRVTPFSTPGEALHLVAPGAAILTADASGAAGYASGEVASLQGTSFAAPAVMGVVALVLQANPGLGWRDVQEVLALSARQTDPASPAWGFNAATGWNGGGLHFSRDHGFGLVDAEAAVRLAETWAPGGTGETLARVAAAATDGRPFDAASGTVAGSVLVAGDIRVQKAILSLDLRHAHIGDLRVSLVSPGGTESVLLDRTGAAPGTAQGGVRAGLDRDDIVFDLASNRFWGEGSAGTWTLRVQDMVAGEAGMLVGWRLALQGDAPGADDTHVYTDEFATLGRDAARAWLEDADGGVDTLNLSAVSARAWVNLAPGGGGLVGGAALAIRPGTVIENLFGGTADDVLVGNAAANILRGGLGHDVMQGGAGADAFALVRFGGQETVLDFAPHEGDRVWLTQGVRVLRLDGAVATLDGGGLLVAANGHAWSMADFVAREVWPLSA